MDSGLREHEDIVEEYFGTIIPPNDNKFAALNTAVWSGGSFIYVPPGVAVDIPLQAYFRINAENMGQFERTLIIADEGSYVHYVEGCSAPIYTSDSLHSAVVEIVAKKGARVRYTTIQNWSTNVYNLVTKRAAAYEDAVMEWIDGNIGSKVTMKYPSIYLLGKGARGEVLSVAFAGKGMHTDAGGKAIHAAPYTTSVINSKSVSKDGGRTGYRGLVRVEPDAHHAKSTVRCDALILDDESRSDTYPYIEVEDETAALGHEATVSKVGDDQLFYLMSRGLSEAEATAMIVNGFIEPITPALPMEYAVELNRLIELQMEGSVGELPLGQEHEGGPGHQQHAAAHHDPPRQAEAACLHIPDAAPERIRVQEQDGGPDGPAEHDLSEARLVERHHAQEHHREATEEAPGDREEDEAPYGGAQAHQYRRQHGRDRAVEERSGRERAADADHRGAHHEHDHQGEWQRDEEVASEGC